MKDFSKRLTHSLKEEMMNAAELADRLDMEASTISRWKNGESKPQPNSLKALAQALRVNEEWLSEGSGKMRLEVDSIDQRGQSGSLKSATASLRYLVFGIAAQRQRLQDESEEAYLLCGLESQLQPILDQLDYLANHSKETE